MLMKPFLESGNLPAKGNIYKSFELFMKSVFSGINDILFLAAIAGLILYFIKNRFEDKKIIPYFTIASFLMGMLSLYMGQVAILLPNSSPYGFFNSRYGLIVLPFVIFYTLYLHNELKNIRFLNFLFPVLIFITSIFWIINYPYSAGSVSEAVYFDTYQPEIKRASVYLQRNYDGSKILYDDKLLNLYPYSRIPIKDRIHKHTFNYGEIALKKPSKVVGWIMFDTKDRKDEIFNLISGNADFKSFYTLVYLDNGIEIYKRVVKSY